jgi:hypothetical protein
MGVAGVAAGVETSAVSGPAFAFRPRFAIAGESYHRISSAEDPRRRIMRGSRLGEIMRRLPTNEASLLAGVVAALCLVSGGAAFAADSHAAAATPLAVVAATEHGVEFWRALRAKEFVVEPGASVDALLLEAQGFLGSPDPELRDEVAYQAEVDWIYRDRRVSDAVLRQLLALWMANLHAKVGESGNDSVLLRSFSALSLSILAALDVEKPFLSESEFAQLLAAAIAYLGAERDVRGFDPRVGWIRSAAHTADLLKFLARNPKLNTAAATQILDAVSAKLDQVREPWLRGEDERLARAVLAVALRADAPAASIETLVATLRKRWDDLFQASSRPSDAEYARVQNGMNVLKNLCVLLDQQAKLEPAAQDLRARLLRAIA